MQEARGGERFSVVIVNYNGGAMLCDAVASVQRNGVAAENVIVIDNGSTDDSDRAVETKTPGIRVVRNNCNAGFARAVNQGLRLCRLEFVLLLNNDASLHEEALQSFASAFDQRPTMAIAGGRLRYTDGRIQRAFGPLPTLVEEIVPPAVLKLWNPGRYRRSTEDTEIRSVESVFGACLAVRRAALDAIGLLDEDFFFYFEEVDWCRRARFAGWEVVYVPKAEATHALGHTAGRTFAAARVEYQRSKLTYFQKSASRATYITACAALLFRSAANSLFQSFAAVLTLFLNARTRRRAHAYWVVLLWQIGGRPRSWGLPGKCSTTAQPKRELE